MANGCMSGGQVVGLIHTNHAANAVNRLRFQYDAQGRAALLDFNGVLYEYVHNLQGDIIGILDGNGELAVEYKYDAWGKSHSVLV